MTLSSSYGQTPFDWMTPAAKRVRAQEIRERLALKDVVLSSASTPYSLYLFQLGFAEDERNLAYLEQFTNEP